MKEADDYYDFIGYSGSTYRCCKGGYGFSMLTASVLKSLEESLPYSMTFEILPEDADFACLVYSTVVE